MELKVRKIGNGDGVLLPKELLQELAVSEGSILRVEKHDGVYQMKPADEEFTRQVQAFRKTEHLHRRSYAELAK